MTAGIGAHRAPLQAGYAKCALFGSRGSAQSGTGCSHHHFFFRVVWIFRGWIRDLLPRFFLCWRTFYPTTLTRSRSRSTTLSRSHGRGNYFVGCFPGVALADSLTPG